MIITTTLGDRDAALLWKTEGKIENDVEQTTWVEYCVPGCDGGAHVTGTPDAPGLFCARHIHRSVVMRLKGLQADGAAGDFA